MSSKTLTLPGSPHRRLAPEALQARVRESLAVENPADNSALLAIERESQMQLRVTDIDPYDRNPRRADNTLYFDIKESIRTARVISPLKVTKRPGATRYMVSAGGNTRLKALRELWEETKDPRYEYLLVTYQPWVSESAVLIAHLVENELHAGMSFWDKATGVWDLKRQFEQERGAPLSLRALHDAMREQGFAVSIALLSVFGFALEQLADLGKATASLSGRTVRELQPVFGFFASYVTAHGWSAEDWRTARRQALQQIGDELQGQYATPDPGSETDDHDGKGGTLDATTIITRLENTIARALGQSSTDLIRGVRQLQRAMPDARMPELLRAAAQPPGRPAPTTSPLSRAPAQESATRPARGRERTALHAPQVPHDSPPPPLGEATASPEPPPSLPAPSSAGAADLLLGVQVAAETFARHGEIDDLLHRCEEMPCGYYVELPADSSPLALDARPLRYWAWWLAAMLSEQRSGRYAHRMPRHSRGRQWHRLEHDDGSQPLGCDLPVTVGAAPRLEELGQWLALCPAELLDHYIALLTALRRIRAQHPDRFFVDAR